MLIYQDAAGQAAVLDVWGWMLPLGPWAPGSAGRLKASLTCTHMMLCVRSSFLPRADGDYEAPREQRAASEHQQWIFLATLAFLPAALLVLNEVIKINDHNPTPTHRNILLL